MIKRKKRLIRLDRFQKINNIISMIYEYEEMKKSLLIF